MGDYGIVETLSGSAWTESSVGLPPGSADVFLSGVSCTGATTCVAAGTYTDTAGAFHALVASLAGGVWTLTTGIDPAGTTYGTHQGVLLTGVRCTSATSCFAVGVLDGPSNGLVVGNFSGTAWTLTTHPSTSIVASTGVCFSTTSCVTVSSSQAGSGLFAVMTTLAGSTLTTTTTSADNTSLDGLACQSGTSCVAVGGEHSIYGLVETLSGTTWTPQTIDPGLPPGPPSAGLSAISCPSATACVAVGDYLDPTSRRLMAETLSGAPTVTTLLDPPGASQATLSSISCTSVTSCVAVGDYLDPTFVTHALVETLTGTTWTATTNIDPAGTDSGFGEGVYLTNVSCTSATSCLAVGYEDSSTTPGIIVGSLAGSTWALTLHPNSSALPVSAGVCFSVTSCVIVSTVQLGQGPFVVVTTLAGATLTSTDVGGGITSLAGLSCQSVTSCVAVGTYLDDEAGVGVLSGTTWTFSQPFDLRGLATSTLSSVSCASATACVGVGWAVDRDNVRHAFVGSLSGTDWTSTTVDPPGAATSSLTGISCVTALACVGAGTDTDPFGTYALIATDAGAATSLTSSPDPSTVGQPATFTATVAGSDNGGTVAFSTDGSIIPGCGTRTLSPGGGGEQATCTTTALSQGSHRVSATYSGDSASIGSTGVLPSPQIVGEPVAITTQPNDQTATQGSIASFSAAAGGAPVPTVQWQVSTDGGSTFGDVDGATADSLEVTAQSVSQSGNLYRAVFTNPFGSMTTKAASLTVTAGPPALVRATSGTPQAALVDTAFAVNLQVQLTDAGGDPLSGVTVTFAAPATGASGNFAGSDETAMTDADGLATAATFTANATTGTYPVHATVSGVGPAATFTLTNEALSITSVAPDSVARKSSQVLTIRGGDLARGAKVKVIDPNNGKAVHGIKIGKTTMSSGGTQLTANLKVGKPRVGTYSVSVTNPGGATAVCVFCLAVS